MALLAQMPPIEINQAELAAFGAAWKKNGGSLPRTSPYSSMDLGRLFDNAVAKALADMLGGIAICTQSSDSLIPSQEDCVEVGDVRLIGGVRPQNFDVVYRPDGPRFASDSKTLNDSKSVPKNWQNMINDIATEATTVHTRYPYAVVTFMVVIPEPCIGPNQRRAIIEILERLARRIDVDDALHLAEVISLVFWNPEDGTVDGTMPDPSSQLRFEGFSRQVEAVYVSRYKGLPPHTTKGSRRKSKSVQRPLFKLTDETSESEKGDE